MNKVIRIGTRSSQLALYQAEKVQSLLDELGVQTELVKITSSGDQNLNQPIYEIGIEGLFTKELDIALLNDQIDIAVHSLKDVPTILPKGLKLSSYLERASFHDILVRSNATKYEGGTWRIATGSVRRRAQWLAKYPDSELFGLRGNVNTRLKKLEDSNWHGAVFAQAGLSRIDLLNENYTLLDWMIPAAGQGTICVAQRESDSQLEEILRKINHENTEKCSLLERTFTRTFGGGCSQPLAVLATMVDDGVKMIANYTLADGSKSFEWKQLLPVDMDLSIIVEAAKAFKKRVYEE